MWTKSRLRLGSFLRKDRRIPTQKPFAGECKKLNIHQVIVYTRHYHRVWPMVSKVEYRKGTRRDLPVLPASLSVVRRLTGLCYRKELSWMCPSFIDVTAFSLLKQTHELCFRKNVKDGMSRALKKIHWNWVMITKVPPFSFHAQASRLQRLTPCRGWLTGSGAQTWWGWESASLA